MTANSTHKQDGPERLQIVQNGRQLPAVVGDAVSALERNNTPATLFVRGGELCRVRLDEQGRPKIDSLTVPMLQNALSKAADFFCCRAEGMKSAARPPHWLCQNIMALGEWPFPALTGVVRNPTIRPDGSLLWQPGYDASTGLIYAPPPGFNPLPLSEHPSPEEIERASALIKELVCDFPFDSAASKANALGMILTPIIRPLIRGTVPMALVDAPQQGTGKTLLSSLPSLVCNGEPEGVTPLPASDEEVRKTITATLLSGPSIGVFDNVGRKIDDHSLAEALTAPVWKDRYLGASRIVELPQRVTWIVTGNNIRLGGDMQRRCYWIRLDAQTSRPWEGRTFRHPDLISWVKATSVVSQK